MLAVSWPYRGRIEAIANLSISAVLMSWFQTPEVIISPLRVPTQDLVTYEPTCYPADTRYPVSQIGQLQHHLTAVLPTHGTHPPIILNLHLRYSYLSLCFRISLISFEDDTCRS